MTDKQNKQEQINRLVKKYPWKDSEELFRAELKQLVEQTRQEAIEENIKNRRKAGQIILSKKEWNKFKNAIENPSKPTKALKELLKTK